MKYIYEGKVLGKGSYSRVYLAKQGKKEYAIKTYTGKSKILYKNILNEIKILKYLNTFNLPYFVSLKDGWIEDQRVSIVLEKHPGTLASLLKGPMDTRQMKVYCYELLKCLESLHSLGIVHRDIKPNNILIDCQKVILCDFNMSCNISLDSMPNKEELVSLWYRSPEVLLHSHQQNPALDIWSAACCFIQMYRGECLWTAETPLQQFVQIISTLGMPSPLDYQEWNVPIHEIVETNVVVEVPNSLPTLDQEFMDLLSQMLKYSPSKRCTATQALQHPWFYSLAVEPQETTCTSFLSANSTSAQCLPFSDFQEQEVSFLLEKIKAELLVFPSRNLCETVTNFFDCSIQ